MLIRFIGKKFSQFYGGEGSFFNLKTITVPSDFPTKVEADVNTNVIYVGGGVPNVTDNDPTKTNTGFVLLEKAEAVWDPKTSMYYELGPQALWVDDGADIKTISPSRNINLQNGGLKDTNVTTPIKIGDSLNKTLNTVNKTFAGSINELAATTKQWTTVGNSATDYTSIQDAIAAGKYNLLILGNFTETQNVTIVNASVYIEITNTCNMGEFNFSMTGSGDLIIESGKLTASYTSPKTLISNTGTGTFHCADLNIDTSASTAVATIYNGAVGNRVQGGNCRCFLSDNATAGFINCYNSSSLNNIEFIGGGANCEGAIINLANGIASNLFFSSSGTFKISGEVITLETVSSILSNVAYNAANRPIISLKTNGNQLNNIKGNVILDLTSSSYNQCSNLYIPLIDLDNPLASINKFTNVHNVTVDMTITGNGNQFTNFHTNADIVIDGGSNYFMVASADDVIVNGDGNFLFLSSFTTYTDNGSLNSNIDSISNDGALSNNSPTSLVTEKAIKTFITQYVSEVINFVDFTTSEPASPSLGDRYINTVTGTSSITMQSVTANYIYEWNGTSWDETVPSGGFKAYVSALDKFYYYTGSEWAADTGSLPKVNTIYFASNGSASNSGTTRDDPVDSPTTAVSKVVSPSSTNQWTLVGIDAKTTSGIVNLPQYTSLIWPQGTNIGAVNFNGNYSYVKMHKIISTVSNRCLYTNGPFIGFADVDILQPDQNGKGIYLNGGSVVRVNIGYINALASTARAYDLIGSTLLGRIGTIRESTASTKDGSSALAINVIDDGGVAGTHTTIYNDFSDISIKADLGNDLLLSSAGAEIDLTAVFVDINASSQIDMNGTIINSAGYINSDNVYTKKKIITGQMPVAGATGTFATGLPNTRINRVTIRTRVAGGTYLNHVRHNGPLNLAEFTHYIDVAGALVIFSGVNQLNLSNQNFTATIEYTP